LFFDYISSDDALQVMLIASPTDLHSDSTAVLTFVGAFECDFRYSAPNYGKIHHPEHYPPQVPPL